jgi:hypothetical protein
MNVYGLTKLWNITQDAFQSNGELLKQQEALQLGLKSVSEILKLPFAREIRMYLLVQALKNLQKGQSIYPSICTIIDVVECLETIRIEELENSLLNVSKAIELLEVHLGFMDMIINCIGSYDN